MSAILFGKIRKEWVGGFRVRVRALEISDIFSVKYERNGVRVRFRFGG